MRLLPVSLGAAVLALALSACAPSAQTPPTYDEVHKASIDAMQRIVDELPEGTPVEDRSTDPDPCELRGDTLLSGDGQFFTGHWVASPGPDFDTKAFIKRLPDQLGEDFALDNTAVEVSFPAVRLRSADGPDVLIDVQGNTPHEEPFIDILAISDCGSTPKS